MKKVVVILSLLIIVLTINTYCQEVKFKRISSHKTQVYLLDKTTNTNVDTLELNSVYIDNSYCKKDSSVYFIKRFVTMTSDHPVTYYIYEYKIQEAKFILLKTFPYSIKICTRDNTNKSEIRLRFNKNKFILSWVERQRKNSLLIPIDLFSLELIQKLLPICW